MVVLTETQRNELQKLWFKFGNRGSKHTAGNHGYIQGFLEHAEDRKDFYIQGIENMKERGLNVADIANYAITQECIELVEKIVYEK